MSRRSWKLLVNIYFGEFQSGFLCFPLSSGASWVFFHGVHQDLKNVSYGVITHLLLLPAHTDRTAWGCISSCIHIVGDSAVEEHEASWRSCVFFPFNTTALSLLTQLTFTVSAVYQCVVHNTTKLP